MIKKLIDKWYGSYLFGFIISIPMILGFLYSFYTGNVWYFSLGVIISILIFLYSIWSVVFK